MKNPQPSLMVHTNPEFKTSNLILDFEFDQHLESHKHVINIIVWFGDMGCYSWIWILYIEDLCDIFGKNKWLFSVTKKSEIDIGHTILVGLHSIWESDPLAMEQWDLQIFSVLQLPNLLYESIVCFPIAITVIGIGSNTVVLVGFLIVLCPCIKCITINVI
jgi:hypothetical protein